MTAVKAVQKFRPKNVLVDDLLDDLLFIFRQTFILFDKIPNNIRAGVRRGDDDQTPRVDFFADHVGKKFLRREFAETNRAQDVQLFQIRPKVARRIGFSRKREVSVPT